MCAAAEQKKSTRASNNKRVEQSKMDASCVEQQKLTRVLNKEKDTRAEQKKDLCWKKKK